MFITTLSTVAVMAVAPVFFGQNFRPLETTSAPSQSNAPQSISPTNVGSFSIETADTTHVDSSERAVKSRAEFQKRAESVPSLSVSHVTDYIAAWHVDATEAVLSYGKYVDGWKGAGSLAPTPETIEETVNLLQKIASEATGVPKPMISADDEGCLSLYWSNAEFAGSIFVYGDGTYSYYVEGYGLPVEADSASIDAPLDPDLLYAMTGYWDAGLALNDLAA